MRRDIKNSILDVFLKKEIKISFEKYFTSYSFFKYIIERSEMNTIRMEFPVAHFVETPNNNNLHKRVVSDSEEMISKDIQTLNSHSLKASFSVENKIQPLFYQKGNNNI